jgi:hypothetical protein
MSTQVRSKSLVIPINPRKTGGKVLTSSTLFIKPKKREFLLALTKLTWVVAAFVSIAFYISVRMNLAEADWLACILLVLVFLGWIMLARYVLATGKPVPPAGQGERHEKFD